MDFKTRFQGKISKITKDGTIDDVIMSTEKMAPIGKTPGIGGGYGGIGTGLATPSEPSTPFESNLDGVSVGFSYQGGLGPSAGTGGGPIVQPSQSTRVVLAAQKPAAPGFKNDLSGPYNSIYDQQNNKSQQDAHSQGGNSSQSTANKSEPNVMQTPVTLKQKLQGNGQQQMQQYSSIAVNKVPATNSIASIDIAKDNIYLKGGSSLADALMSQQRNVNAGQSQTGLSIAMRMKKNREAASGITPGPVTALDKSPMYHQDSSSSKPSYLDSLQVNSLNPPSQLSNAVSQTAQQSVRGSAAVNSQSKPPSGTQQLRQSVERQRSTSFVSISKQIVGGPSIKNLDSIRTANNNEGVSLTPGLQKEAGPQTLEVTLNERLKNNNQGNQVKRNNSYAVKSQQPSTIQVGSSNNDLLQKRAMSVANQPTVNSAVEDSHASPQPKGANMQNQNNSSSLQVPRRAGAYRSAGIKAQLQEKQSEQKSQLNMNGQNIMNSNPLMSNPYQQQFMNNNNMSPLSPDQLQQQLLMMQQQILLLQQQQSMFSQQVPPNSSPPMLYNKNNSPSKLPINQPGVSNRVSDVYRQIEQADKNFSNQVALVNQLPYNIPAGSLTGQVGGYGQHGGSPVTDPFVYQQMQQKGIGGIMMDAQSTVSEGGKSGSYKRYTVKDYKQLQQTVQTLKMGGLGANIGSEEWEKAKKKFDAAQEYAKSLRQGQALQATASLGQSYGAGSAAGNNPNSWSSQQLKRATQEQRLKEKTAREKALEFAKSIPKPKVKPQNYDQQSQNRSVNDNNNADMNGIIEEEAFDEYGNTLKGSEFNDLNYRHDNLQGEVDKIKRMFN